MQLIDPKDIKKDRFFVTSASSKADHREAFGENRQEVIEKLDEQAANLVGRCRKQLIPRKWFMEK
jgi:hypothetical protein